MINIKRSEGLIAENIDAEDDFDNLDNQITGKYNQETDKGSGDALLTGIGTFGVGSGEQHLVSTPDEHDEENKAGDDHD